MPRSTSEPASGERTGERRVAAGNRRRPARVAGHLLPLADLSPDAATAHGGASDRQFDRSRFDDGAAHHSPTPRPARDRLPEVPRKPDPGRTPTRSARSRLRRPARYRLVRPAARCHLSTADPGVRFAWPGKSFGGCGVGVGREKRPLTRPLASGRVLPWPSPGCRARMGCEWRCDSTGSRPTQVACVHSPASRPAGSPKHQSEAGGLAKLSGG